MKLSTLLLASFKSRFKSSGIKLFSPLLILLLTFANASAQNTANVVVSPSDSTVTLGSTFTVRLRVEITSGSIDAAEVHLDFDKTILNVTAIATSAGNPLPLTQLPFPTIAQINTNGHLHYAAATSSSFPTTSFNFVDVTFTSLITGTSPLTFTRSFPLHNTDVQRSGASALGTITNGNIHVLSCTPPTAVIANTGTCNSQPFNLVLNSATGVGPYSLVINGTTYNNVPVGGTITTVTPASQNFFGNGTPGAADDVADAPVTLGLKFSSSVSGFVKGVRFFSQAAPSGTYSGQLWTAAGALLASATFTGVTANAWQQVSFPAPVLITANTIYIISYHTTSGYMAEETALNTAITSGVLTAPATGTVTAGPAGNGLYTYDPVPGSPTVNFPISTFNATNYEVDVIFTPNTFTYNLTSVTDNGGCTNVGAPLQVLNVTSIDCSTLPVTLLNLSASPKDKDVVLRWSTVTELNNKGFELQRRTANSAWETIGFVNGAGNSSAQVNYTYTDKNLFSGRYFYQLKQVDIDGHYKFSMVVSANIDGKDDYAMTQNYPNPFHSMTTIQYTLPQRANVNISIFDMSGRVMKVLVNGTTEAGNHAQNFYSGALPPGMYYYRIQAGSFSAVKKMIIQ